MTRALLPRWQQRGSGHIVVVSSISGFASTPPASPYAATKFGLRGFALNLREDLRGTGVGVSVITPGMIREAGMFADSGAAPPPGIGTGTPHQVGNGVVRAIERDKLEISVAPLRQRALALRNDGARDRRSIGGLDRYEGGRRDCLGPDRKTVARSHGSLRSDYRPTLSVHRLDVLTD
jgi:short-subunit dehydrogenase